MARAGLHLFKGNGISSRQEATFQRTKLIKSVKASIALRKHIDDIVLGFVSMEAKSSILAWKQATEQASHYVNDARGDA